MYAHVHFMINGSIMLKQSSIAFVAVNGLKNEMQMAKVLPKHLLQGMHANGCTELRFVCSIVSNSHPGFYFISDFVDPVLIREIHQYLTYTKIPGN